MEQKRIKYRIQKTSSAPMTAVIFTLLAVGCLIATYWSVLYKYYFQGGGDYQLYKMTIVYSVLIGSLVLFALFTGSLGKRTLSLSAICAVPICLYYVIERCGLLQMLVSKERIGFFEYYEKNTDYFSGNNLLIVCGISLFMLMVMCCFWAVVYNGGKSRSFAMFVLFISPFVRIAYAYYDVATFSWPLYFAKKTSLSVFAYDLLDHAAAVFFLFALMVLAASLKKTIREKDTDADGVPGGPVPPAVSAQPEEHSFTEPEDFKPTDDFKAPEPAPLPEPEPVLAPEPIVSEQPATAVKKPAAKRAAKKPAAKKAPAKKAEAQPESVEAPAEIAAEAETAEPATKKPARKRAPKKAAEPAQDAEPALTE